MSKPERRLPAGSLILVTGANGYIGSHIVNILLQEGYNVRGTVRDKKPWLDALFEDKYGAGKFQSVVIPDLSVQEDLQAVLDGVSGVIHSASDLTLEPDREKVINGTIAHILATLKAAAAQPSVKSFVLTSSSSSALVPVPNEEGVVVDESTWNDEAVKAAWSQDTPEDKLPYIIYAASKTEGERSLWKWAKENNPPPFVVNAVLPDANYGPILAPEIFGSTMGWVRKLLEGDPTVLGVTPPQWFVDVRDCARLHVAALLDPTVENQRIFAFAAPYNWTDIINLLHKLRPQNNKIPEPPENEGRDLSDVKPVPKAEQLLRRWFGVSGWVQLQDSVAAGIEGVE